MPANIVPKNGVLNRGCTLPKLLNIRPSLDIAYKILGSGYIAPNILKSYSHTIYTFLSFSMFIIVQGFMVRHCTNVWGRLVSNRYYTHQAHIPKTAPTPIIHFREVHSITSNA